MKKWYPLVNLLPLLLWGFWFGLSYLEHLPEIVAYVFLPYLMLGFLLVVPIIACYFNLKYTNSTVWFILCNAIFLISQVVGYYSTGMLYYNIISSDSGTLYITNEFSVDSVIYVIIITLVGLFLKRKNMKKQLEDSSTENI